MSPVWLALIAFAGTLSGSAVLGSFISRRWQKGDKSLEDAKDIRLAEMKRAGDFTAQLLEERKVERAEHKAELDERDEKIERLERLLSEERENCDDRHDRRERANERYILVLEEALRREGKPLPSIPEDRAESA